MPVPFEALIPYGIMLAMFGISGAGMSKIRHMQNGGKRGRRSLDQWDKYEPFEQSNSNFDTNTMIVMDRDNRLTGMLRGQTDNVDAPRGFELNNPWRLEKRFL
ncbi:hypothetical protein BP6252_01023 [Coleophoma cylindrospora]|uniref:NADH dehydrogenase [ubiquinone] 1 alpha subcomplex subunit 1 n=1 Tax=Coleophoma cylindrospora TaxID=1849047 RepID=A0A3D8SS35_9HELO|nr:hypothetical protein BP6252_01023 [Coleophoma cylindrospora]